jgi:hypothetical protein
MARAADGAVGALGRDAFSEAKERGCRMSANEAVSYLGEG